MARNASSPQAPIDMAPVPARAMTPLAQEQAPTADQAPRGQPLPHAPVMRAQKMQFLMNQAVARGMANQLGSAAVLGTRLDADTWRELTMMQLAVWERLQQQQRDWVQGLTEIVQDYSQLRLANTLSKFVEQEYNIGAQIGALMASQTANLAGLMENIQVDYAYWISQKHADSA